MAQLKINKIYKNKKELKSSLRSMLKLFPVDKPQFTFIDLFAGIGGVRLGFQENKGLCVFSSEFDKHAQETYFINHGETPFGDITKIPPKSIPDHDVLLAGLKRGIEDTRGTLFHDIAKILDVKKPKFAVLENVKNHICPHVSRQKYLPGSSSSCWMTTIIKTYRRLWSIVLIWEI